MTHWFYGYQTSTFSVVFYFLCTVIETKICDAFHSRVSSDSTGITNQPVTNIAGRYSSFGYTLTSRKFRLAIMLQLRKKMFFRLNITVYALACAYLSQFLIPDCFLLPSLPLSFLFFLSLRNTDTQNDHSIASRTGTSGQCYFT